MMLWEQVFAWFFCSAERFSHPAVSDAGIVGLRLFQETLKIFSFLNETAELVAPLRRNPS